MHARHPMSASRGSGTRPARAALLFALAATALLWQVAPAAAQQNPDPYGGTTTTTRPAGGAISCNIGVEAGQVGARGTVVVTGAPLGAKIRVLLGSIEVGSSDSEQAAAAPGEVVAVAAGAPVLFGQPSSVTIGFTVPELEPGMYQMFAVGVDFTVRCRTAAGGDFEVLGTSLERPGGGGSLPFTGASILGLLLLAVALLLLGRWLRRRGNDARPAPGRHHPPRISA